MREEVAEGHFVIEGGLLLQGEEPGVLHDGDEERAPGALDRFYQPLEFYLCCPQVLSLGTDGVCGIRGDSVVVGGERNRHTLKGRADAVFYFVVGVQEQEVREVDGATIDVDRLKGVDERLDEPLDIIVVWRADERLDRCE